MTRDRRAASIACWTLQWSLSLTLFVAGLLEAALLPGPSWRGLVVSAAAVAMVVPSMCRFFPVVAPLAATFLAFLLAVGARTPSALVLATGCLLVGVVRGLLLPIEPADLRPEPQDPIESAPHPQATSRRSASRWARAASVHR